MGVELYDEDDDLIPSLGGYDPLREVPETTIEPEFGGLLKKASADTNLLKSEEEEEEVKERRLFETEYGPLSLTHPDEPFGRWGV